MSYDNEDLVSLQSFRRSIHFITTQGKKNPSHNSLKSRHHNSIDFGPSPHIDATFIRRSCSLGTDPTAKTNQSTLPSLRRSCTVGSSQSVAALAPRKRSNDPFLPFSGCISRSHHKTILRRSSTSGLDGKGERRVRPSDKIFQDPPADAKSECGEMNAPRFLQRNNSKIHFVDIDFSEKIGHLLSLDRPLSREATSAKTIHRQSILRQNSLVSSNELNFDKKNVSPSSTNPIREEELRICNYGNTATSRRRRNSVDVCSVSDSKILSKGGRCNRVAAANSVFDHLGEKQGKHNDSNEIQSKSPWAETKWGSNAVSSENRKKQYLHRKCQSFREIDCASFYIPSTASQTTATISSSSSRPHPVNLKQHFDYACNCDMFRDPKNAYIGRDSREFTTIADCHKHYIKTTKKYRLGEAARSTSDLVTYSHIETSGNQNDYLRIISSLNTFDFAFIKRSNGQFTYAILADRFFDDDRKYGGKRGEECMRFVLSSNGTTKVIRKKFWLKMICLVNGSCGDDREKKWGVAEVEGADDEATHWC